MLTAFLALSSLATVALPVGLALNNRRKARAARKAARMPPLDTLAPTRPPEAKVPVHVFAPPPPTAPNEQPAQEDSTGKLLQEGLEALTTGNVIAGGWVASEGAGRIVESFGGEGKGDLARLGGITTVVPFAVDHVVNKGLEALGVEEERHRKAAGQIAATASIAPPLVPLVATVHAASELLELISPEANKATRDFVKQFDPTNPETEVGKLVDGITDVLFGKSEPPPPVVHKALPPAQAAAKARAEARKEAVLERKGGVTSRSRSRYDF